MMINFKLLESMRNKREVAEYFKANNVNITEEEIDALKANYDKAERAKGKLTLKQLDDVAGGVLFALKHNDRQHSIHSTLEKFETTDANVSYETGLDYLKALIGIQFERLTVKMNFGNYEKDYACKDLLNTPERSEKILVFELNADGKFTKVEAQDCKTLSDSDTSVKQSFQDFYEYRTNKGKHEYKGEYTEKCIEGENSHFDFFEISQALTAVPELSSQYKTTKVTNNKTNYWGVPLAIFGIALFVGSIGYTVYSDLQS